MPPTTNAGAGGQGRFQQWPKGTKWAYFKNLPNLNGSNPSKGWVRVGSKMWNQIKAYNASGGAHDTSRRYGGQAGTSHGQIHPTAKATQRWSPASPAGKLQYTSGKVSAADRGLASTPGQNAGKNGTDKTTGLPKTPPKTPPKDTNQTKQEAAWSKFIGNPNTQGMIPMKDAAAQAGLQYNAQIKDASTAKADQVAQAGQNLADIKTWYSHLMNMNAGAQTANNAAVNHETAANQADLMAGLSAIGGGANNHAGGALAQGLQANEFARQMGANQDAYFNGQATALGQNEDAQRLAQKALDSQTSQSLDSNLQNLLGQRGNAIVTNQMAIIAANNAARQGNFGNRTSKAQSIAGLLQLGLNAKISAAQLSQMGAGGNHGHIKFVNQTPAQKQATILGLLQGGKDPAGHDIAVPLTVAAARAKALGYDAAPGTVLWNLLSTYTH